MFAIATALEAQAEAILEAAETGKMNMPSGEYLRMANEAKAIWQQAQDLKGMVQRLSVAFTCIEISLETLLFCQQEFQQLNWLKVN